MTASLIVVKIRFKSFVLIYLTCANSREKNQIEDVNLVLKPQLKHFKKYLKIPIRIIQKKCILKRKNFSPKILLLPVSMKVASSKWLPKN